MNQNLFEHFALISKSHGIHAEDLADRLSAQYTSIGLMFLATLLVLKQYIFKPIQCMVPAEWPRPHEEYAENYCWIQNTYHAAIMTSGHPELRARQESEISYFQWVPILLSIQAALVLLPHAFWRAASSQSRLDPHAIVSLAAKVESAETERQRRRLLSAASARLSRAIALSQGRPKCRVGCVNGCRLFLGYAASKAVHLLCGLGHLHLMRAYLNFDELSFGWRCTRDLLASGGRWQRTPAFPRVTFCDVAIKDVGGQWNTHSVQCVLPANMINEKIYIFLWFWTVFCMALTAGFGLHWIYCVALPWPRRRFIGRLARLGIEGGGGGGGGDRQTKMELQLRVDDAFVLRMVAVRCGELCAAQILELMELERPADRAPASAEVADATAATVGAEIRDPDDGLGGTLPLRGLGPISELSLSEADSVKKVGGGGSNGKTARQ